MQEEMNDGLTARSASHAKSSTRSGACPLGALAHRPAVCATQNSAELLHPQLSGEQGHNMGPSSAFCLALAKAGGITCDSQKSSLATRAPFRSKQRLGSGGVGMLTFSTCKPRMVHIHCQTHTG